MEARRDNPTIIASAELPRIGRVNEPRHVYVHEDGSLTMDVDPTNFADLVGPDAHQEYLGVVDARRGTHFADRDYVPRRRERPGILRSALGRLGLFFAGQAN